MQGHTRLKGAGARQTIDHRPSPITVNIISHGRPYQLTTR
jgi:hypothetical protein